MQKDFDGLNDSQSLIACAPGHCEFNWRGIRGFCKKCHRVVTKRKTETRQTATKTKQTKNKTPRRSLKAIVSRPKDAYKYYLSYLRENKLSTKEAPMMWKALSLSDKAPFKASASADTLFHNVEREHNDLLRHKEKYPDNAAKLGAARTKFEAAIFCVKEWLPLPPPPPPPPPSPKYKGAGTLPLPTAFSSLQNTKKAMEIFSRQERLRGNRHWHQKTFTRDLSRI